MSRLYVYQKIEKLVRRHGTRDPFELLDAMHVQVRFYYDLTHTKGFTRYFLRQYFVGINGNLRESEQRIVAAHELGHIVLHAQELRTAPLFDTAVYDNLGVDTLHYDNGKFNGCSTISAFLALSAIERYTCCGF